MNGNIKDTNKIKEFTVTCLMNEEMKAYPGSIDIIKEYWEKAETVTGFKNMVFADSRLKKNQGYAELSKETEGHWFRVREMFGDRCFKISSDIGAVKVEGSDFAAYVPNGNGDGPVRCAVFEDSNDFNENMMKYTGMSFKGKFSICNDDCADMGYAVTLNGTYSVYIYLGLVAFVKQPW